MYIRLVPAYSLIPVKNFGKAPNLRDEMVEKLTAPAFENFHISFDHSYTGKTMQELAQGEMLP
jgi:hypothetical protein